MVLTRSQRRELEESSSSASSSNSSSSESDSSESATTSNKAKATPAAPVQQSPAKYGRGCRERRQTHFFEEEVVSSAPRPRRKPSHNSDDDHHEEDSAVRRFPMRDAARRAVEKMHSMLLDEEEEDKRHRLSTRASLPSRAEKGRNQRAPVDAQANRKRTRSDSPASSAIATASESELDGGDSSDTSEGIINDDDARRALQSARDQKTPLTRVVKDLVSKASPKYRTPEPQGSAVSKPQRPTSSTQPGGTGGEAVGKEDEGLGDITPLPIDPSISFASVGGLPQHIVALREMIMIPLLYPNVLSRLGAKPPRGVLFVGPPGTGKTLLARAVANECQSASNRKVSFYMRKGADILSKWVGESEKQLRLLFDEARKHQPSIIFFDEIDGLAPIRHSKQEQTHAALVSTLLALMDGMDDRGQVVIIGATNRPDTIDPALRRPGRFDRELRFSVPDDAARRHIINIHTSKMSIGGRPDEHDRVTEGLLKASEGWTGADIQACCTEATLHALRSKLPQIFLSNKRLKIPDEALAIHVSESDVHAASLKLAPSLRRAAVASTAKSGGAYVPPILEHMDLLVRTPVLNMARAIERTFQPAMELARHNSNMKDTSDLLAAIRTMNAAPLPHIPRGALSVLVDNSANCSTFGATEVVKGLAKHYASFPAMHVSLPLLLRGTVSVQVTEPKRGPSAYDGGEDEDVALSASRAYAAEHAATTGELFSTLRNLAPCVVYFHDVGCWLTEHSDVPVGGPSKTSNPPATHEDDEEVCEHVARFRTELLATLQSADVLAILPIARDRVVQLEATLLGLPLLATLQSGMLMCKVVYVEGAPHEDDHQRWVSYLWGCAEAVQYAVSQKNVQLAEYPEDDSPPPPLSPRQRRADHAQQKALWQRVEYKRRQLRHLLAQWLSQFIAGRRFQILLGADLDLNEDSPQWADWQRHVRGRRVGLQDIMEKLENEEYTCLSQYVNDIEQLCSNVRTFFVTRSIADQKYRHRAMELKETTVLNMYKIHKNVTSFCEDHKDMCEPISSDDEDDNEEAAKPRAGPVRAAPAAAARKKKTTKKYFGDRRRKKRTHPVTKAPTQNKDSEPDEGSEDEESEGGSPSESPNGVPGSKDSVIVIDDTPNASPIPDRHPLTGEDGGEPHDEQDASMHRASGSLSTSTSSDASSVYGNIGSMSPSSAEGDKSPKAGVVSQLFPSSGSKRSGSIKVPHNAAELTSAQLMSWACSATRQLSWEGHHMVTFHVLKALDAWRWESSTTGVAAVGGGIHDARWEIRFAGIWEAAVRSVMTACC